MTSPAQSTDAIAKDFEILHVDGLSKRFGGVQAVNDVSLEVPRNSIVGLIGPNGAGKTTVFNLITGLETADSGTVYFDRHYITGLPAHKIVRSGVARTFQNIRLLDQLSVLDNVKIAYHNHIDYHIIHAIFRFPRFYREEREITDKSIQFLELFGLADVMDDRADSLAYGQRRRLEIARALATEGTLLLLDEPAAGMNPQETEDLMTMIRKIRAEFGVTILMIEHDMKLVMSICDIIFVMDHGSVIARGKPEEIRKDPAVIEAYLGVKRSDDSRNY